MLSNLFAVHGERLHSVLRKGATCGVAATLLLGGLAQSAQAASNNLIFSMVPSQAAASCLPRALGRVTVTSAGEIGENLHVEVGGLPTNTGFDFFVIQVPNAPFGLSWYQGDIQTDGHGVGVGDFTGKFDVETFIVAPGIAQAPVVFNNQPFPDANANPKTLPVQTYHLGLWFDSPDSAKKAGCPGAVTPFNGSHNAGVQALSTRNWNDLHGPLRYFTP